MAPKDKMNSPSTPKKRVSFSSNLVQERLYIKDASISPTRELVANFSEVFRQVAEEFTLELSKQPTSFNSLGKTEFPSLDALREIAINLPTFQKAFSLIDSNLYSPTYNPLRIGLSENLPYHLITLPVKEEKRSLAQIDSLLAECFRRWLQYSNLQRAKRKQLCQAIEFRAQSLKRFISNWQCNS